MDAPVKSNHHDAAITAHRGRRMLTASLLIIAFAALVGWAFFYRALPPPPSASPVTNSATSPLVEHALSVTVEPEQSVSGRQVRPAPSVILTDDQGRPVAGAVVSASIEPPSFADGSVAEATTDEEGRAVFDSLVVAQAGAYRLAFTSTGYDTARSAEFVVRFGIPRVLTVVREPLHGAAGAPVAGEPSVRITDDAGNPVPGINVDARLEAAGTAAEKIATSPTDDQGVAVFTDIVIPAPGADYRLKFKARAAGVNDAVSTPFNLTNS
jgi:5-hydroxyisourate hydrolase-like protein (transthyretin family)